MTDLHDPELRGALWRASGDDCDTGDALLAVEARVRRIRRRRMDVVGLALLAAVVVTLGIASRAGGGGSPGRPTSPVTEAPATSVPPAPTTPTTPSVVVTDPPAAAPSPVDSALPSVEPAPPDSSAAEVAPDDTAEAVDAAEEVTPAAAPQPANTSAAPAQQTFVAVGGRLTVAVSDGVLTIVSATPRDGYTVESPTATGASVAVEFRSDNASSRIRVDLVGGRLRPTIRNDDGWMSDDHRSRTTSPTTTPRESNDGSGSRSGRAGRDGWSTDASDSSYHR
jgi:hypothetical protein